MKQMLFTLTVASFGLLVLAVPTPQPVKPVDPNQERIDKLNQQSAPFDTKVKALDKDYQLAIATKNATLFGKIINEVKEQKTLLIQLVSDVNSEISNGIDKDLFQRIELEFLLIRVRNLRNTFKNYALEILGYQNGISDFPSYHFSESVQTGFQLLEAKLIGIVLHSVQLRDLLNEHKFTPIDKPTQAKVHKNLDEMIANSTSAIVEIERDYNVAILKLNQQDRVVNLAQKSQIELTLDMLVFMQDFLANYKETFTRIHG